MFSIRHNSRVWSLALILCIVGSMVASSVVLATDNDRDRFATDNDRDRFATDNDRDRFAPLSFGNITTQLLDIASTEVITRAAYAVLGYRLFSSALNVGQNAYKTIVVEPVNKPELSEEVIRCRLARCNPLLDIGL